MLHIYRRHQQPHFDSPPHFSSECCLAVARCNAWRLVLKSCDTQSDGENSFGWTQWRLFPPEPSSCAMLIFHHAMAAAWKAFHLSKAYVAFLVLFFCASSPLPAVIFSEARVGMRWSFCAVSKNIAKPFFFFVSYGRFIKQTSPRHSRNFAFTTLSLLAFDRASRRCALRAACWWTRPKVQRVSMFDCVFYVHCVCAYGLFLFRRKHGQRSVALQSTRVVVFFQLRSILPSGFFPCLAHPRGRRF